MDGGQAYPKASGWKGLKEGSSTQGDVCRALNVDFDDGKIRRRRGRRVLCTIDPLRSVSRILEHVTVSGSREVLVGLVAQADPTLPPRLGRIPVDGGTFTEIALPDFSAYASPEGFFWSSSYRGGHTILSDPTGRMLDYDGQTCSVLSAVEGTDSANALAASRAYLKAPPPADIVLAWRNRIAAIQGRTVGLSADSGDPTVPSDAPASGANLWPASTNFDVLTQEGDEVLGAAVQGDQLVGFTRRGVVVVPEDSVSPVPRTADKQHGCVAPRSVQEIGGGAVVYLSDKAICVFDGVRSRVISDDVQETLALVNWSQAYRAVSAHVAQRTEYRLWLPVRGATGNRICVIFDYSAGSWRVYSGWYPWDQRSRDLQPFDVTAAATVLLPTGEEIILTGDSQGRVWREDVGEDDQGTVFPAFFALVPYGDGESVVTWRDWRVEVELDGSYLVGIALANGDCLEQEIARVLDSVAPVNQIQAKRLWSDDRAGSLSAFDAAKWPIGQHTAEPRGVRLGFSGSFKRLQPLILMPGQYAGVVATGRPAVSLFEIAVGPAGGRRG